MDQVRQCIISRRSVRAYSPKKVDRQDIIQIIQAAAWAPSGNNLQPWKFSIVMNDKELLKQLSALTIYQNWVKDAPCLIAVFLDTAVIDDRIANIYLKHVQAIGAAIQNMLLAARELGLGTCWIGEILKNEDKVLELLGLSDQLQLMAVIAVGYSSRENLKSLRKDISESIVSWL